MGDHVTPEGTIGQVERTNDNLEDKSQHRNYSLENDIINKTLVTKVDVPEEVTCSEDDEVRLGSMLSELLL